jgi:predicted ABC-type ATPase
VQTPGMFIIAGPPGAGKSSVFPLNSFADQIFNADDRAAELNHGSYREIPMDIRGIVNREFELFIQQSIARKQSFAFETTRVAASRSNRRGLRPLPVSRVFMTYVALDSFETHFQRVLQRALLGGHAASESTLRKIHESSLANLSIAFSPLESGIEFVRIYDNSFFKQKPKLVLESAQGQFTRIAMEFPNWLRSALRWSDSELAAARLPAKLRTS